MTLFWLQVRLGFRKLLGIRDVRASRLQFEVARMKRRRSV